MAIPIRGGVYHGILDGHGVTMGSMSDRKETLLSAFRVCEIGVLLSGALDMRGSLQLIIGY